MLGRLNGSVSLPNLLVKTQNYFSVERGQSLPLKTFNNTLKISLRELAFKIASLIETYSKKTFRAATVYLQFLIKAKSNQCWK